MSGLRQTTEARGASTSSSEDNVGEREHLFNSSFSPSEHIEAGQDTADQKSRMGFGVRLLSFFSSELSLLSPNYLISLCALFCMCFCTIKIGMCAACTTTPSVDPPAQETEEKENKRPAKGAAALEQACWYQNM